MPVKQLTLAGVPLPPPSSAKVKRQSAPAATRHGKKLVQLALDTLGSIVNTPTDKCSTTAPSSAAESVASSPDIDKEMDKMFGSLTPVGTSEPPEEKQKQDVPPSLPSQPQATGAPLDDSVPLGQPHPEDPEIAADKKHPALAIAAAGNSEEDPKVTMTAADLEDFELELQEIALKAGAGANGDDPNEGSTIGKLFEEAARENFDIRGVIGQRFQRAHKKGSAAAIEYAKCKSHEEKRIFRQQWAAKRFTEIKMQKREMRSWREVDIERGEYMPLARLIECEGYAFDPIGAMKAGYAHARRCASLGGQWICMNHFTGRLEYLKLRKEFEHQMVKSWQMFTEYSEAQAASSGEGNDPEIRDGAPAAGADGGAGSVKKRKQAEKSDGADKAEEERRQKPKKEKSIVDDRLIEARKLRAQFLACTASTTSLIGTISQGGEDWTWANNTENLGKLKGLLEQVESGVSRFGKNFILGETGDLKKEHDHAQLQVFLEEFLAVKDKLKALEVFKKKVLQMQQVHKRE